MPQKEKNSKNYKNVDYDNDTRAIILSIINRYLTRDAVKLLILFFEKKFQKKYLLEEGTEFIRIRCQGYRCPWKLEIKIDEHNLNYIDKTKILTSLKKHKPVDHISSYQPMDIPFKEGSTMHKLIKESRKKKLSKKASKKPNKNPKSLYPPGFFEKYYKEVSRKGENKETVFSTHE